MTDSSNDFQFLVHRVERLERQNRIWRWIVIGAIVILVMFPLTWFMLEQGNLESRSFVLMDKQGTQRAVLSADADGSPSLVFYGKDGRIQVLLNSKPDGSSSLALYDQSGKMLFKAP